jgi:hypothetical protein
VVSASADPDTIKLSVNIESNSLSKPRSIRAIESKQIGSKKKSIKLAQNGGVIEEEIIDNDNCCINDEDLLRLGDIAVKVLITFLQNYQMIIQLKAMVRTIGPSILRKRSRYRIRSKRWLNIFTTVSTSH